MHYTATYSPEDNKLRLYASSRLPREQYDRVKAAGFIWATKQELFVAPMWTPQREDLLIELAGEIGDEDTSLVECAEERADRFEDYRDKRTAEADRTHAAVSELANGIPLGQPILIGHHSQKRAERDRDKIQDGTRKAIRLWETSQYWKDRAAGAIRHAKYKELPAVRARRIKGLEADRRKHERTLSTSTRFVGYWQRPDLTIEQAKALANAGHGFGLWSDLDNGAIGVPEAAAKAVAAHRNLIAWAIRWIAHLDNRLTYERAMLAESRYTPPAKKPSRAALPLLNYGGQVSYRNPYYRGEVVTCEAKGITKAELAAIHTDYKGTRVSAFGTHRVRTAMIGHALYIVYLTDSKQHPRPGAAVVDQKQAEETAEREAEMRRKLAAMEVRQERKAAGTPDEREAKFDALAETLKAGIQVVSVPQLFPTPAEIAAQVVELAAIQPGHSVLEPSVGAGALLDAIGTHPGVVAVEVNHHLAEALRTRYPLYDIRLADFLALNGELGLFDRIVMNPPFERGADIKHIRHAYAKLAPGGRLVAICANGPRQREELGKVCTHWIDLPAGSFKEQGTHVNTAIVVIDG